MRELSIRITEIENSDLKDRGAEYSSEPYERVTTSPNEPRVFKVEGTLHVKAAQLLERICRQVAAQTGRPVLIDLNDVCFVDYDAAAILCRLKRDCVAGIDGLNLFTRKVVELADESQTE